MNDFSLIQSQLSSVWPEWKITRRLGKGSFGYVYEILRDDLGNRYTCAMKVLQMVSEESDPSLEEFVRGVSREINMMMQLKGAPNIVTIEDYAVLRGDGTRTILIRMEELESVESVRARQGGMDRRSILQLGLDICTALINCEKQNIIHRDIKLSNIFFSEKGGYKLGDFGISRTMDSIHEKMSMSSTGTIQYMAPEVYFGYRYDNTVDIYSLGIALYILLNGNLPPLSNEYNTGTGTIPLSMLHEANMRRLRGTRLPRPAYADERLGNVICTACDPDPARRFRTAEQFREALLSCADPRAAASPGRIQPGSGKARASDNSPAHSQHRGGTPLGKRILPYILLIALLASLACAMVFIISNHTKNEDQEPEQEQIVQEESGSSEPVTYTISYLDVENRQPVADSIVVEGNAGATVTLHAKSLDDYTPVSEELTITLSENSEENQVLFYYEQNEEKTVSDSSDSDIITETVSSTVTYTVTCVDTEGNTLSRTPYSGTTGSTVTEAAPEINGYVSKNTEVSIVLSPDADNNIIFVYVPEESVSAEENPNVDIPAYGTLLHNGHTYFAYASSTITSFREAEEYCESRGGYLAVINNDAENTALYNYVFKDCNLESSYFGLTDENVENSWEWVDGTPYSYENWLDGQPDNLRGVENYALFYYKDTPYKWNDGDFGKDPKTGKVFFLIEWDVQL